MAHRVRTDQLCAKEEATVATDSVIRAFAGAALLRRRFKAELTPPRRRRAKWLRGRRSRPVRAAGLRDFVDRYGVAASAPFVTIALPSSITVALGTLEVGANGECRLPPKNKLFPVPIVR